MLQKKFEEMLNRLEITSQHFLLLLKNRRFNRELGLLNESSDFSLEPNLVAAITTGLNKTKGQLSLNQLRLSK